VVTVLKLGGSVVTRKDEPETIDRAALDRAVTVIADADPGLSGDLVVVHGGGSFGHHHAAVHGVTDSDGTHDAAAVEAIHGAMRTLNDAVVSALREVGVPAVPVHPLSLGARDANDDLDLPARGVETMLDEGFTPILHGDLVPHAGEGVTVLSGDEIVVSLARSLDADRVGLCSTVPGVLDADGEVVETVDSVQAVTDVLGESESTDVTGGMAGKVRALLGVSVPASIFDLDGLGPFLAGGSPGTTVNGSDD